MENATKAKADILVVDDEAVNRILVKRCLKDGYVVREAGSGLQALELVKEKLPDLILLDVHMPQMSGHDVIKELKSDENGEIRAIPVVLMTADDDLDTELVGLKEGADDFITKPFRPDILIQRINRIVELNFLKKNLEDEVRRQTQNAEERSRKIEQMSLQTVQTLANAIDAKDQYTRGHSTRVSQYAILIAKALGWDEERIEKLRYAALLHDVGKIGVPDAILNSPKRLEDTEYAVIRSHTTMGGDILKNNIMINKAEDVALHHHERYDGLGYPEKIAGENISEEARIVAIADAYDAMKSKRIYRKALSSEQIREELINGRGSQFDPEILDIFMGLIDSGVTEQVTGESEQEVNDSIENGSDLLRKVMESFVAQNGIDEIDVVSGLLGRSVGERAIAGAMQEEAGCFVFFDVDNLKKINDIMGHNAGDKALRLVGDTVLGHAKNCVACRLGGDEFLMFIKEVDREAAEERVTSIFNAFEEEKIKDPQIASASLSAGMVMSTPDDVYVDIYNKADKALYHVKQNGKAGYYFYTDDPDEAQRVDVDIDKLIYGIKNSGSYEGAMDVEFRQFAKVFEYIANLQKRYDHSSELLLITLQISKNEKAYIDELEHAMYCMEQAIKMTIRNVDVVTRYSSVQFLVILFEVKHSEIENISERITQVYYRICGHGKFTPKYTTVDMTKNTDIFGEEQ